MDSYSGRFPLDFISFCLDEASEQQIESTSQSTVNPEIHVPILPERPAGLSHEAETTMTDAPTGPRPLSNLSSSSGNTEESFSTFAEQTMHTLAHMDPS